MRTGTVPLSKNQMAIMEGDKDLQQGRSMQNLGGHSAHTGEQLEYATLLFQVTFT